jgi:hypothetical protein
MVEQARVARAGRLPLQIHAHLEFDENERGRPYQLRLRLEDDTGETRWLSNVSDIPPTPTRRHRVAVEGIEIPDAGYFHVVAEYRPAGDEAASWQRSTVRWPFQIEIGGE